MEILLTVQCVSCSVIYYVVLFVNDVDVDSYKIKLNVNFWNCVFMYKRVILYIKNNTMQDDPLNYLSYLYLFSIPL